MERCERENPSSSFTSFQPTHLVLSNPSEGGHRSHQDGKQNNCSSLLQSKNKGVTGMSQSSSRIMCSSSSTRTFSSMSLRHDSLFTVPCLLIFASLTSLLLLSGVAPASSHSPSSTPPQTVIPSLNQESKKETGIEFHSNPDVSFHSSSKRDEQHSSWYSKNRRKGDEEEDEEEDDYFNEIIAPSILDHSHRNVRGHHDAWYLESGKRDWEAEYEREVALGRIGRLNKRHALHTTPYESETWLNPSMTTATVLSSTSLLESSASIETPSLSSSSVFDSSSPSSSLPESSSTPIISPSSPSLGENGMISTTLLPDSIHRGHHHDDNLHNNHPQQRWRNLYTTPTLELNPPTDSVLLPSFSLPLPTVSPTDDLESSSTTEKNEATPVFVGKTASVPAETESSVHSFSSSGITPSSSIGTPVVPSSASTETSAGTPVTTSPVDPSSSTTEVNEGKDDNDDNNTDEEENVIPENDKSKNKGVTASSLPPGIFSPPNSAPVVKRRIQKLSIDAGTWFKFVIPEDTFWDEEEGSTRNLKLGLYLPEEDSKDTGSREPLSADHWIQFDVENQFLYALPTDKSIGKHKFILLAVDSNGAVAEEVLQINVRQHKGSRRFHHEFFLYEVSWDTVKYPVLIQAAEKLLSRISNQLYGDSSLDAINVLRIEPEEQVRRGREDTYTISYTNESLPAFPCPRDTIDSLYDKLADRDKPVRDTFTTSSFGSSSSYPSRYLNKILLSSEFKVKSVGLSLTASCEEKSTSASTGVSTGPVVRNQLDILRVPVGHVYRYKIPKDMFYSGRGSQSLELDLDLFTIDGKRLPSDGFVHYNVMTQEIYALGLGDPLKDSRLQQQEYMLVAKDMESSQSVTAPFVIEFIPSESRDRNAFEVTMTLTSNTENDAMTIDSKITLMYRIATHALGDADPSSLKILSFKKGKYAPQYHNLHNQMQDDHEEKSTSRRKKRTSVVKREVIPQQENLHLHSHATPQTYASYYEIIWTNRTLFLDALGSCPANLISDNIIRRLFSSRDLDTVARNFGDDYKLLHVSFHPTGDCINQLQNYSLGEEPVAVSFDNGMSETTRRPWVGSNQPTLGPPVISQATPSEDEQERDIYMTTILPAVVIMVGLLMIALMIVCCLVRHKRGQEKARFEVIAGGRSGFIHGDYGHYTERDAFLSKGRTPVIFEQEMTSTGRLTTAGNSTPYGFYSPVIMPPPPAVSGSHTTSNLRQHNSSAPAASQSMSHHYNLSQHQMQSSPHHLPQSSHPLLQHQATPPTPHHAMQVIHL